MLVVIVGTEYAGRKTLQAIVNKQLGFKTITLNTSINEGALYFASTSEMLSFVTYRWQENFVTTDLTDPADLDVFSKRPFCLVIYVDAPIMLRYSRCKW